jgi:hypothetical protein
MQYTLGHVRFRLTPIPFFRVCIKHLSKDDGEKICKNNYVNDDTLTDGGLKSLKQCCKPTTDQQCGERPRSWSDSQTNKENALTNINYNNLSNF